MSDATQAGKARLRGAALDAYKRWKPEGQQRALARLREAENNQWRPFYCLNRYCNGQPHMWPKDDRPCPNPFGHVWVDEDIDDNAVPWQCAHCEVLAVPLDEWDFPHARTDQRPPRWKDDWLTLLLRGGRGSGKTRTGAEITNRATTLTSRIILIGATGPDLRNTMVEGESGILATSPPGKRPIWEPSKKKLTWPNGCIGQGFSAEEPDRLRGPQSGYVWGDEPSHWDHVDLAWENMLYGLRLGKRPKAVATSTPKPNKWTKETVKAVDTVDRVVSTYANLGNLAATFKRNTVAKFEGTRRGQQELEGQLLEDVEGALWHWEYFNHTSTPPEMKRIVVAVDPAGTANKRSDETGIIVLGLGFDDRIYVLADATGKYSPAGWGRKCVEMLVGWSADAVVAEKNYGGDMVKFVIDKAAEEMGEMVRVIPVNSRRGKAIRAEPVVGLYEQKRIIHVGPPSEEGLALQGDERTGLILLEEEQTSWVPGESPSPNRVDALVHGVTNLAKGIAPAAFANPNQLIASRFAGVEGPNARHLRAVR